MDLKSIGGGMKKAILVLVIVLLIGTAMATPPIPEPKQEEYFKEESAVQGVGVIKIQKKILDKAIAVKVSEQWIGVGEFAMHSKELLNESANRTATDFDDPWNTTNYYERKLIEFRGENLVGFKEYEIPKFYGGIGAKVREYFETAELQTEEWAGLDTTSDVGEKQVLVFNTMNQFNGTWGVNAEWNKVCKKEITHLQEFSGEFAVHKKLEFMEDVIRERTDP